MKLEKLREIASKRTRDGFIPIDNMIMLETHIHGLLDVVEAAKILVSNHDIDSTCKGCLVGPNHVEQLLEKTEQLEEIE